MRTKIPIPERTTGFFKNMNIKNRLKRKRTAVDGQLKSYLAESDSAFFQAIRYAVFSGGKRYRPLLTLAAADYFGVEEEKALPFACAIELIHNYSLVHDDLPAMDNDDYRRNKLSCHTQCNPNTPIIF